VRSQRLLQYLVESSLDGTIASVTAEEIAVRALQMPPDQSDVVELVEKEMRRLRGRLADFEEDTPGEPYYLTIPKKSFVPSLKRPPAKRAAAGFNYFLLLIPLLLGGIAVGGYLIWQRVDAPVTKSAILATVPGEAAALTLSPDEDTLLFHARTVVNGSSSVQSLPVSGGKATEVNSSALSDSYASFSPNRKYMAYFRRFDDGHTELLLRNLSAQLDQILLTIEEASPVAWSPASVAVYISKAANPGEPPSIHRHDLASNQEQQISRPDITSLGDTDPIISSDAKLIAFRRKLWRGDEIWIAKIDGSNPKRLALGFQRFSGHAFAPDNRTILASYAMNGNQGLWRVHIDSASAEFEIGSTGFSMYPVFSKKDNRLFFIEQDTEVAFLRGGKPLAFVKAPYTMPIPDAEEKRFAYIEPSANGWRIRVASASYPEPLSIELPLPVAPDSLAWSPDGSDFIVSATKDGRSILHTISVTGGQLKPILDNLSNSWFPAFDAKGERLIYTSDRSGKLETWSVPWPRQEGQEPQPISPDELATSTRSFAQPYAMQTIIKRSHVHSRELK
jgi:Tol biopolymer transport system component